MERRGIVVIEDDAIIQVGLKRMLQKHGYDVVGTASEGEEALRVVYKTHPTAVLMDIHLKGKMSGIDVYHELVHNLEGINVIFLTAYDLDDLKNNSILKQCECIKKPYVEADILSALNKIFSAPRAS